MKLSEKCSHMQCAHNRRSQCVGLNRVWAAKYRDPTMCATVRSLSQDPETLAYDYTLLHIDVASFPQQFSIVLTCSPAQLGSRTSRVLSPGTGGSAIGRPESKGREGASWSTARLFRG